MLLAICLHLVEISSCTRLKHIATTTSPRNRYKQHASSCSWAWVSPPWGSLSPMPMVERAMKQKYVASRKLQPVAVANAAAPRHTYEKNISRTRLAGTDGDDDDAGGGVPSLSAERQMRGTRDGVSCVHNLTIRTNNQDGQNSS